MRKDPTEFRKRFAKWKETGEYELPRFGDGEEQFKLKKTPEFVQAGKDNSWSKVTNDGMGEVFQSVVVRPNRTGGNISAGSWKKQWEPKHEKPLEIVSPEFELLTGARAMMPSINGLDRKIYHVARQMKRPTLSNEIVDDYAKSWFNNETTFRTPFRSKGRGGDKVGDFIDYNYATYGGRDAYLSQLSEDQRYRLAKLLQNDERFPKTSTVVHMDDTGLQPVNGRGFVPKDATNSKSPWNNSIEGDAEIWWNRGTPYYNAKGYRHMQDIPRTIVSDIETLSNHGITLQGRDVLHGPGVVPFNAVHFGLQPNLFGWFDRIKFVGQ